MGSGRAVHRVVYKDVDHMIVIIYSNEFGFGSATTTATNVRMAKERSEIKIDGKQSIVVGIHF